MNKLHGFKVIMIPKRRVLMLLVSLTPLLVSLPIILAISCVETLQKMILDNILSDASLQKL